MYNHYLRVDSNGFVIKVFSDAFKSPTPNDILFRENTDQRQVYIGDHNINPNLFNDERIPLYVYENGEIRSATEEEKETYKANLPPAPKSDSERIAELEETIRQLTEGGG